MASPGMKLGELIDALENFHGMRRVLIAGNVVPVTPTGVGSHRGHYEDLALVCEVSGYGQTVATVLDMLRKTVGSTQEGYKGGTYTMTRDTPVWVSEYGEASGRFVSSVTEGEWDTILINTEQAT